MKSAEEILRRLVEWDREPFNQGILVDIIEDAEAYLASLKALTGEDGPR